MAITYCIECNITGEKYYGSTVSTLKVRMNCHRNNLNCASKEIILRGDYDVYKLGEYETEEQARLKEKWYIDNKDCININRVSLTDEERKENQKKYDEKIYQENKEQILENKKIYYEENTDDILDKRKEYYQENKEKILEKRKEYHQKNKQKILQRKAEKVECEFCKSICRKGELKRHQRSKKCLKFQ